MVVPRRRVGVPMSIRALGQRVRSVSPATTDLLVAGAVLFAVSLPFWLRWNDDCACDPTWLGFLFSAATAIPLIWRRKVPLLVALLVSAATVAVTIYHQPGQPLPYALLVAVYTLALIAPRWQRIVFMVGSLVGISLTSWFGGDTPVEFAFTMLVYLSSYVAGRLSRLRQAYTSAVEDRAARMEREHAAELERAAATERARIAHDMHDVLAHAVSLMVVQAEAGPVAVRSDPERAEAAFEAIATAGRDAMVQLRRMLGQLGEAGPRSPQPRLADLPELVARVERAGPRIVLTMPEPPEQLPPDVELAAYRIVQEALTNTIKHAAADQVSVCLAVEGGVLRVVVRDDGRGASTTPGPGGGHGLIGIRERTAAYGGDVTFGPGDGSAGFEVDARIPLEFT